jgi:type II secretory pathway pseudopilin PulG
MQTDDKGSDPPVWQKIENGRKGGLSGMSLTEVLVVICFLAIVAAVAIPSISNVLFSSSYETAKRNMNLLNGAVLAFNQGNWDLVLTASAGSSDELAIFDSLRYRNPDVRLAAPGSPYLPPNATFVASSTTNTYRARWNGRMFEILPVGTNGTGLDLMKIMGAIQDPPTSTPIPRSTNP